MTHLLLVLFLLGSVQASEYEEYFGKYWSTAKKDQVAFEFAQGNVAGLFTNKEGRVVLDLLIKGQSPKPGIGVDTQMAQARLKGKAQEEMDKAKQQAAEAAQKQAEELKKKAAEEAKKLFKWK